MTLIKFIGTIFISVWINTIFVGLLRVLGYDTINPSVELVLLIILCIGLTLIMVDEK